MIKRKNKKAPESAKRAIVESGQVTVTKTFPDKSHSFKDNTIKIRPFATTPAKVKVSLGRTISTSQFEFARIDVGIEVPCYVEEIADTYRTTKRLVQKLMEAELAAIDNNSEQSGDADLENILSDL